MRRAVVCAFVVFVLTGCATPILNTEVTEVTVSMPVRWRVAPDCMASHPLTGGFDRQVLATICRDDRTRDLVALALSGGGTKAAIFSGEAMFYLQALGLLQQTSIISSVSGGSFAGALYALSCDAADGPCRTAVRPGLTRPLWRHDVVMAKLGAGYSTLVREQLARLLVPAVGASISSERFADVIDQNYLGRDINADTRFTFRDLNPRRPHLFINATILSRNRGGLEAIPGHGCQNVARGYLRRRTPDEFFHFAFSDYYFGLLKSTIADYPVAGAVAASAAFPALIDNATLRDFCGEASARNAIRLMDGGANDNQALIEIYLILSELALNQARSDLSVRNPSALERMRAGDRAWFVVVNSSVTESTGLPGTVDTDRPRSVPGLLLGVVDKILSATDTYSAIGYDLRRQLYLAIGDRLETLTNAPTVRPVDISLTALDNYYLGGSEGALRARSGIGLEPSDISEQRISQRAARQRRAYRLVEDPEARSRLHLSNWHPQCYFDMRAQLDASLVSVAENDQACLREAARWAAALRAQELCDGAPMLKPPEGIDCSHDLVRLRKSDVLQDNALPGRCQPILPAPTRQADAWRDPRVTCQALSQP